MTFMKSGSIVRSIFNTLKRVLIFLAFTLSIYYLTITYIFPAILKHYAHFPQIEGLPKTTFSETGTPSDPINIALIGTKEEVSKALIKAGWRQADPINAFSDIRIAESVFLDSQYRAAPISSLYLWGRPQDLGFERTVGGSARRRHHVRLWKSKLVSKDQRPVWIGSATFDEGLELQLNLIPVTHKVAPDVDLERDTLILDLEKAGQLIQIYQVTGVGQTFSGRNADGDWYYTDGEITFGVISPNNEVRREKPKRLRNPIAVEIKNRIWEFMRPLIHKAGLFEKRAELKTP